ncbi:conserved hypothetical protein, partial [Ricinus communis]
GAGDAHGAGAVGQDLEAEEGTDQREHDEHRYAEDPQQAVVDAADHGRERGGVRVLAEGGER